MMTAADIDKIIASDEMPGTRTNPMPDATDEQIATVRRAWSAADPMTQDQRNDLARIMGWADAAPSAVKPAGCGHCGRPEDTCSDCAY